MESRLLYVALVLSALVAAAACDSSGDGGPLGATATATDGGGSETTATVSPAATPSPTQRVVPSGWTEFHQPADRLSDGYSLLYPAAWTLDPPTNSPISPWTSLVLTSYDPSGGQTHSFPPMTTKLDLYVTSLPLVAELGPSYGCPAKDSTVITENGREVRRTVIDYPEATTGQIARVSVVEIRSAAFAYCFVAGFTGDVPRSDDTFEKIVASFRSEGSTKTHFQPASHVTDAFRFSYPANWTIIVANPMPGSVGFTIVLVSGDPNSSTKEWAIDTVKVDIGVAPVDADFRCKLAERGAEARADAIGGRAGLELHPNPADFDFGTGTLREVIVTSVDVGQFSYCVVGMFARQGPVAPYRELLESFEFLGPGPN